MTAERQTDKMVSGMELLMKQMCITEFLHAEKWHPLTFTDAECLWRLNSRCEHNQAVGSVIQQWQLWVTSAVVDSYEQSMKVLVHCW